MNVKNILLSTRIYRTLPTLLIILVSSSFAGYINLDLLILALASLLIYSAAGIQNAINDSDYSLDKNSRYVIYLFFILALIFSFYNKIILITAILWIVLGLLYNTLARYILLGDSTIIAITHFALPSFSSSLLLGLDFQFSLKLSLFFFLIFWFIIPSKNIKDLKSDKKRGYKTLTTLFSNGILITTIFKEIFFIFVFLSYFILELTEKFLFFFLFIYIIRLFSDKIKNEQASLFLSRFLIILFLFSIILDRILIKFNLQIIILASFICILFLIFFFSSVFKKGDK